MSIPSVQVRLNSIQAKILGFLFLADIEQFCEEHQEEYEEFLKKGERKEAQHGKQQY